MSNRPKGFKRMLIFHITEYNHRTGKAIIKGFDERLPNDEYYQRLIKNTSLQNRGRLKLRKIFNYLKTMSK